MARFMNTLEVYAALAFTLIALLLLPTLFFVGRKPSLSTTQNADLVQTEISRSFTGFSNYTENMTNEEYYPRVINIAGCYEDNSRMAASNISKMIVILIFIVIVIAFVTCPKEDEQKKLLTGSTGNILTEEEELKLITIVKN